jgi:hypothetical protein
VSFIRPIYAAADEIIEIHWQREIPRTAARGSLDPHEKDLTQILVERHTAPPAAVWDAHLKDTHD